MGDGWRMYLVYFYVYFILFFFFFFQAEDGIRDVAVTGVQTCALPICGSFIDPQRGVLFHETRRSIGTNPRGASLSMKHFLNDDLAAPNALVVRVDHDIVREFLPLSRDTPPGSGYSTYRPSWSSDIRWIAPNSAESFEKFDSAFRRLGVASHVEPYLDLDKEVRLYAGFLVIRSACEQPNFHVDWEKTNNEAFTLITPVTDNSAGFGLLYRKLTGEIAEYEYKVGEAII